MKSLHMAQNNPSIMFAFVVIFLSKALRTTRHKVSAMLIVYHCNQLREATESICRACIFKIRR